MCRTLGRWLVDGLSLCSLTWEEGIQRVSTASCPGAAQHSHECDSQELVHPLRPLPRRWDQDALGHLSSKFGTSPLRSQDIRAGPRPLSPTPQTSYAPSDSTEHSLSLLDAQPAELQPLRHAMAGPSFSVSGAVRAGELGAGEGSRRVGKGTWKGRAQRMGAAGRVRELGCREKLIDRVSWRQQRELPGQGVSNWLHGARALLVSLSSGACASLRVRM